MINQKIRKLIMGSLVCVLALSFSACKSSLADQENDLSTAEKEQTADEAETANEEKFPSFEGKDLDGNDVKSSELFSGNTVTVVNFWFTTCGPCVSELGELDQLNQELQEKGGSLIGINAFTLDGNEQAIAEAKEVLSQKGASYQNISVSSDSEAGQFTTSVMAFPTTYVVDSSGSIVGEPIVGAINNEKQMEMLQKLIDEAIEKPAQ